MGRNEDVAIGGSIYKRQRFLRRMANMLTLENKSWDLYQELKLVMSSITGLSLILLAFTGRFKVVLIM